MRKPYFINIFIFWTFLNTKTDKNSDDINQFINNTIHWDSKWMNKYRLHLMHSTRITE